MLERAAQRDILTWWRQEPPAGIASASLMINPALATGMLLLSTLPSEIA